MNQIDAIELSAARDWPGQSSVRNPDFSLRSSIENRMPSPIGLYSGLTEAVAGVKTGAVTSRMWKDLIKGLLNKGLVNSEEIQWVGLHAWLDQKKGTITKEEVQAFLNDNAVQVGEVLVSKSEGSAGLFYVEESRDDEDVWVVYSGDDEVVDTFDSEDEAQNYANEQNDQPLYSEHVLTGAEQYREVLLTLPPAIRAPLFRVLDRSKTTVLYKAESEEKAHGWLERNKGLPAARGAFVQEVSGGRPSTSEYKSDHWNVPNVLAHMRLSDRRDETGARVLFVDEIQSDWASAGRVLGFQKPYVPVHSLADPRVRLVRYFEGPTDKVDVYLDEKRVQTWKGPVPDDYILDEINLLLKRQVKRGVPAAAFVGSTERWVTLCVKRLALMAAEGDYDKLAFTTGDQVLLRSGFRFSYDALEVDDLGSDRCSVRVLSNEGGEERVVYNDICGQERLDAFLGVDIAARVSSSLRERGRARLSGLDATFTKGGAGLLNLYDTIVPRVLKKLLRSLDEASSVQSIQIEHPAGIGWNVGDRQIGFEVTRGVHETLRQGLPMFSFWPPVGVTESSEDGRRDSPAGVLALSVIKRLVKAACEHWPNAPRVHVLASMEDPQVPGLVRLHEVRRRRLGAAGKPEGFWFDGVVYLVGDTLRSPADVLRVLLHETVGHYGLRGAFGPALDGVLDHVVKHRRDDILAKARHYGLVRSGRDGRAVVDVSTATDDEVWQSMDVEHQRHAAEEVLATMAQQPFRMQVGVLRRAVGVIRGFFRRFVPWLQGMRLTDEDIAVQFIAPARHFVERGGLMRARPHPAMSLSDQPREQAPVQFSGGTGFYSALFHQVESYALKSAPVQAWGSALQGLLNGGKIKADELEWSGLKEWLSLQTGRVTKVDVLRYLSEYGVKIQVVHLSGMSAPRIFTCAPNADGPGYVVLDHNQSAFPQGRVADGPFAEEWEANNRAEVLNEDIAAGRYEGWASTPQQAYAAYNSYVLPGGGNYRVVLLKLPGSSSVGDFATWLAQRLGISVSEAEESPEYEDDELHARFMAEKSAADNTFYSKHWDEPNVLVHVRLTDRTDEAGRHVLFVEEIQSDWAQELKKRGGASDRRAVPDGIGGWRVIDRTGADVLSAAGSVIRADSQQDAMEQAAATPPTPAGPFIDTTDKWVSLALRRLLKMAVDGGYERVAFITGEQSAQRYFMSQNVDRIRVSRMPFFQKVPTLEVTSFKDGDIVSSVEATRESLAAMIGKELAVRALAQVDAGQRADFSGLDVLVGGNGMKIFYDKIVPFMLKDLLKKFGGDEGLLDVRMGDLVQPGFSVTPKMVELATPGVPLFSFQELSFPVVAPFRREDGNHNPPRLREDILSDVWLQGKINQAIRRGRNAYGVPHMSSMTGYFDNSVDVPLRVLSQLKGENDEQNNVREQSLQFIRQTWDASSQQPPYVAVSHNGEAWVNEGNHRILVAAEKGLESMPVEIRYFDGGQRQDGPLAPARIASWTQAPITTSPSHSDAPGFKPWLAAPKMVDGQDRKPLNDPHIRHSFAFQQGAGDPSRPYDFAGDTRFHHLFYGSPSAHEVRAFASWLRSRPNDFVRLYHGTAAVHPVLEQGLLPATATRRNSLQSSSGFVCLSVFPGLAHDFGAQAALNRPADASGARVAVYPVTRTIRSLLADLDQLRNRRLYAGEHVGNSLAESLIFGRGARVRGRIDPGSIGAPQRFASRHVEVAQDVLCSYAGVRAQGADLAALDLARRGQEEGVQREVIRKDTGWHQGVDGHWRFEIDDSGARILPAMKTLQAGEFLATDIKSVTYRLHADGLVDITLAPPAPTRLSDFLNFVSVRMEVVEAFLPEDLVQRIVAGDGEEDYIGDFEDARRIVHPFYFSGLNCLPLDEVLDHPSLFKAYPSLRNIPVQQLRGGALGVAGALGKQEDGSYVLQVGASGAQQQLKVLLHEIQHAIQYVEGFATGGSIDLFRNLKASIPFDLLNTAHAILKLKESSGLEIESIRKRPPRHLRDVPQQAWQLASVSTLERIDREHRYSMMCANPVLSYLRLAGEVEARDVESRINLSEAGRKHCPPGYQESIPEKDWLVMFEGDSVPFERIQAG
jgi:hypothetical protein